MLNLSINSTRVAITKQILYMQQPSDQERFLSQIPSYLLSFCHLAASLACSWTGFITFYCLLIYHRSNKREKSKVFSLRQTP